ncbi:hypothetical protein AURDEDRAFT_77906 [Auricularia subglabra TFB-10046 SS5]|nr:hypothetical protein AURDEDRAFT_77906 [Auricularia subglabra TFB-10046 SS5]
MIWIDGRGESFNQARGKGRPHVRMRRRLGLVRPRCCCFRRRVASRVFCPVPPPCSPDTHTRSHAQHGRRARPFIRPNLRSVRARVLARPPVLTAADLLLRVKPRLGAGSAAGAPLVDELEQLASRAEALGKLRPKAHSKARAAWQDTANTLDREGVNLWNASSLLRAPVSDGTPSNPLSGRLFGALRLAAFRLIVAGLEQNPALDGV